MATDLVFNRSYTPPIGSRVILDFKWDYIDWNIASIGSVSVIIATPRAIADVYAYSQGAAAGVLSFKVASILGSMSGNVAPPASTYYAGITANCYLYAQPTARADYTAVTTVHAGGTLSNWTASMIGEGLLGFRPVATLISASMMTADYSIPTIWMDKVGTYEIKYY